MPKINYFQFLKEHLLDNISAIDKMQCVNRYYQGVRSAFLEILLFLDFFEENQED